jgi:hypothetical protein
MNQTFILTKKPSILGSKQENQNCKCYFCKNPMEISSAYFSRKRKKTSEMTYYCSEECFTKWNCITCQNAYRNCTCECTKCDNLKKKCTCEPACLDCGEESDGYRGECACYTRRCCECNNGIHKDAKNAVESKDGNVYCSYSCESEAHRYDDYYDHKSEGEIEAEWEKANGITIEQWHQGLERCRSCRKLFPGSDAHPNQPGVCCHCN